MIDIHDRHDDMLCLEPDVTMSCLVSLWLGFRLGPTALYCGSVCLSVLYACIHADMQACRHAGTDWLGGSR